MLDELLRKNLLSSVFYKILMLLLNFIFISLFMKISGVKAYGTYVLYLSLVNLGLIFNAGVNNAFVKYIGENRQNKNTLQSVYSTLMGMSVGYIAVVFCVFLLGHNYMFSFVGITGVDATELFLVVLIFVFMFLNSNLSAILNAFEMIYISNKAQGILDLSKVIVSSAFLYFYGVKGALLGLVVSLVASNIFLVYHVKRVSLFKLLNVYKFDKSLFKEIIGFSLFASGNALIWRLFSNIDKVLVSKLLGVDSVGFYNVACSIAVRIWEISSLFSTVAYPRFLALKNNMQHQVKIFIKLQLVNNILIFVVVIVIGMLSNVIISVWINKSTAVYSSPVLRNMLVGVFLGASNFINAPVLLAYDRHRLLFVNTSIGFLCYLVFIFFLKERASLEIFAYGFSLYFAVSSLLTWVATIRILNLEDYALPND